MYSLSKAFISQAYMYIVGTMVVTCNLQLDVLMNGNFFFIILSSSYACLSIFFLGPERFQQNT